jgi:RNA polymerase sigma-70 factor (ECF subfamily)
VVASPATNSKFRRLFDENYEAISRYCLRRLPLADVNDATAEVFVVAWKKIEHVPAGEEALPWLYGVARNVVHNTQRSTRRQVRLAGRLSSLARSNEEGPETVVVRHQHDQLVAEAVERLRPKDREVLRLRAQEGLTSGEIAVVLGISPEAAKKRVTRALARIRKSPALQELNITAHPRAVLEGGE